MVVRVCRWFWMAVRFVCVIRVPVCVPASRVAVTVAVTWTSTAKSTIPFCTGTGVPAFADIGQRRAPTGHFFRNVAGQLNGQLLRFVATRNQK